MNGIAQPGVSGHRRPETLEQSGFADVTLYGHLDGRVYGPEAPRLVAVARKGASNLCRRGRDRVRDLLPSP